MTSRFSTKTMAASARTGFIREKSERPEAFMAIISESELRRVKVMSIAISSESGIVYLRKDGIIETMNQKEKERLTPWVTIRSISLMIFERKAVTVSIIRVSAKGMLISLSM